MVFIFLSTSLNSLSSTFYYICIFDGYFFILYMYTLCASTSIIYCTSLDLQSCKTDIFLGSKFLSLSLKNFIPWLFLRLHNNYIDYFLTLSAPSSVSLTNFYIKVLRMLVTLGYFLLTKLPRNRKLWTLIAAALSSSETFIY